MTIQAILITRKHIKAKQTYDTNYCMFCYSFQDFSKYNCITQCYRVYSKRGKTLEAGSGPENWHSNNPCNNEIQYL